MYIVTYIHIYTTIYIIYVYIYYMYIYIVYILLHEYMCQKKTETSPYDQFAYYRYFNLLQLCTADQVFA